VPIVRIGHPARVLESVVGVTLDVMVHSSDEKALAKDAQSDLNKILCRIGKEVRFRHTVCPPMRSFEQLYRNLRPVIVTGADS